MIDILMIRFTFRSTVKPAPEVTSIKQSPVLKGHVFLIMSLKNSFRIEPLLRGHLSYKATFSLSHM